jgi:hypothetical protein
MSAEVCPWTSNVIQGQMMPHCECQFGCIKCCGGEDLVIADLKSLLQEVLAHPAWMGHNIWECDYCDIPGITWEESFECTADIPNKQGIRETWTETETMYRERTPEEIAEYRKDHPCNCGGEDIERRAQILLGD